MDNEEEQVRFVMNFDFSSLYPVTMRGFSDENELIK